MRIQFIRAAKPRSRVLEELYTLLRQRDCDVSECIPDQQVHDLDRAPEHDLYVLKARDPLPVSMAGVLHHRGARLLNSYGSCVTLLDKFVATSMLRSAGVPTPRSWAASDPARLDPAEFGTRLPLIVKPFDGIHSRGVRLVRTRDELASLRSEAQPILVQEFVSGCDRRYKLHGVGDAVFATWKRFSLGGDPEDGTVCEPGEALASIARTCARLFGLVLYGLDVLVGRDGPVVVDVNSFPGYAGVPEAPRALADTIEQVARGQLEFTPR